MSAPHPDSYADIIHRYAVERQTSTSIAQVYGTGGHAIIRILREHNVIIRDKNKQRTVNIDARELRRLYIGEHLNSPEIAARYHITFPTVLRLLRKHNIPVRDSHDGLTHKTAIQINTLPAVITNAHYVQGRTSRNLIGIVTCPDCGQPRTLTLSTQRASDIARSQGRCNKCAGKSRSANLDITAIATLYETEHTPIQDIATRFGVSDHTIYKRLRDNGIRIRTKEDTRAFLYRKSHPNQGTLESPILGDIRKGIELLLGLKDPTYYMYVECPECHSSRWQVKSHAKRSPMCRECSLIKMGFNHSGPNAPVWLGGKSFEPYTYEFNDALKEAIRARDNYACQFCGTAQNGKKLAVHHIDYNKRNSAPSNLISLCQSQKGKLGCHTKTNHNRDYWMQFFQAVMVSRNVAS